MPHQIALTVLADVEPGQADELKRLLSALGGGEPAGGALPFARLGMVHFARMFVLDEAKDLAGAPIPARLVFMTDLDAPLRRYLDELVDLAGPMLDSIYGHCEGYPPADRRTRARRLAYLRSGAVRSDTVYVNTIGRSVRQVRQEAQLWEAIQAFLDRPEHDWAGCSPTQVQAAVRDFVTGAEELRWARRPARPPGLPWRIRQAVHLVAVPLLVLLLTPLIIAALPFWLVALRRHERADPVPDIRLDHARTEELAALEDRVVQNPLSAVGLVKPGRFRLLTTMVVLRIVNYATRHVSTGAACPGSRRFTSPAGRSSTTAGGWSSPAATTAAWKATWTTSSTRSPGG